MGWGSRAGGWARGVVSRARPPPRPRRGKRPPWSAAGRGAGERSKAGPGDPLRGWGAAARRGPAPSPRKGPRDPLRPRRIPKSQRPLVGETSRDPARGGPGPACPLGPLPRPLLRPAPPGHALYGRAAQPCAVAPGSAEMNEVPWFLPRRDPQHLQGAPGWGSQTRLPDPSFPAGVEKSPLSLIPAAEQRATRLLDFCFENSVQRVSLNCRFLQSKVYGTKTLTPSFTRNAKCQVGNRKGRPAGARLSPALGKSLLP